MSTKVLTAQFKSSLRKIEKSSCTFSWYIPSDSCNLCSKFHVHDSYS